MRKKDVKGLQKESEKSDAEGPKPDNDDEDELQNMKQGAINLLAVDSDRVALYCAMSNVFVESFFGTLFGFVFIIMLLGFVLLIYVISTSRKMLTGCCSWQSLVAGLLVIALTTPMNIYFTKKYSKAQDDLMKIR
jgi:hypothetical protein